MNRKARRRIKTKEIRKYLPKGNTYNKEERLSNYLVRLSLFHSLVLLNEEKALQQCRSLEDVIHITNFKRI